MPARPRTAVLAAALVGLAVLLAGCSSAPPPDVASPAQSSTGLATPAATTSADTSTATSTVAPSTAPPTSSAPASTRPAGTTTVRPTTAPATVHPWVRDPEKAGYDFGFVWGAKRSGDAVLLTFDRAGMLTGARAKAYYDAHPGEERFDYKILNDRSFTETLRVPASATLYGNQRLGPGNGAQNQRITLDRLVARASGGDRSKAAVWLKRSSSGSVAYLAEQYLP